MKSLRHFALVAVATAFCVAIAADRLQACSCAVSGPPCQETWRAGAVFVGMVTGVTSADEQLQLGTRPQTVSVVRVHLTVTERFRGELKDTVDVFTSTSSSSCGYEFSVNRAYLVYAHWDTSRARWSTSICSRTRQVQQASEDLAYLRSTATSSGSLGVIQGTATREDPDPLNEYREFWRKPYPGARVVVESVGTARITRYEVKTDAEGRFVVPVPTGRYRVMPVLPPTLYTWTPPSIELRDVRGCADGSFAVRSDGRIAGRVVDALGAPVADLTVEALEARSTSEPYYNASLTTRTDATGKFEFTRLPPDTYRLGLDLRKEPRGTESSVWFRDEPDGPPSEILLALERHVWTRDYVLPASIAIVRIAGVVADAADKPVGGVLVYLMTASKTGDRIAAQTTTDARGEFRFGAPLDREFKIVAEHYIAPGPGRRAESGAFRVTTDLAALRLRFDR